MLSPLTHRPSGGERLLGWSFLVLASGQALGCALALPAYNYPSEEKIRVVTKSPEAIRIRVNADGGSVTQVPPDGRALVDVPTLPRECSRYFFGIRITNGHPEAKRVIEVWRDGRVERRLSLNDLNRLRVDADGYRELVLK